MPKELKVEDVAKLDITLIDHRIKINKLHENRFQARIDRFQGRLDKVKEQTAILQARKDELYPKIDG